MTHLGPGRPGCGMGWPGPAVCLPSSARAAIPKPPVASRGRDASARAARKKTWRRGAPAPPPAATACCAVLPGTHWHWLCGGCHTDKAHQLETGPAQQPGWPHAPLCRWACITWLVAPAGWLAGTMPCRAAAGRALVAWISMQPGWLAPPAAPCPAVLCCHGHALVAPGWLAPCRAVLLWACTGCMHLRPARACAAALSMH